MDDAELVHRAATCDKEAFAHVYDRHAAHLHEFLVWVLQDRDEADEALYATFVEAGARIHELADPAKLRPWLFAVASRQALRQAPRRTHHNGNGNGNGAPLVSPDRDTSWQDLVQVVRGVGSDLSPRDRALLDLRFRQGLADDDLGAAIGTEPDTAASLVERVTERVEGALGDTVVAYLGQKDCPELQDVLGEFDGRLTERQRQIVEQHTRECDRCGARLRKHVGAPALLRVTPAAAVPASVTARVLDDVQLAAHSGRPWSARRNGFPPPLAVEERRRWVVAVAAAVILLVGTLALIVTRDDGGGERVAAVGTTVARSGPSTTRATTSTVPATTTTLAPPDSTAPAGGTTASTAPPSRPTGGTGGAGGGTGGGGTGGGGGGTGTNTGTDSPTNTTTAPTPTTEPTTTLPPDTTPPTISGLSISPSTVRSSGGSCSNNDPTTATVTASVSDASGISSVTATTISGSHTLQPSGGGSYSATVGPFSLPGGGALQSINVPVVVVAVDAAGNRNQESVNVTVRCSA